MTSTLDDKPKGNQDDDSSEHSLTMDNLLEPESPEPAKTPPVSPKRIKGRQSPKYLSDKGESSDATPRRTKRMKDTSNQSRSMSPAPVSRRVLSSNRTPQSIKKPVLRLPSKGDRRGKMRIAAGFLSERSLGKGEISEKFKDLLADSDDEEEEKEKDTKKGYKNVKNKKSPSQPHPSKSPSQPHPSRPRPSLVEFRRTISSSKLQIAFDLDMNSSSHTSKSASKLRTSRSKSPAVLPIRSPKRSEQLKRNKTLPEGAQQVETADTKAKTMKNHFVIPTKRKKTPPRSASYGSGEFILADEKFKEKANRSATGIFMRSIAKPSTAMRSSSTGDAFTSSSSSKTTTKKTASSILAPKKTPAYKRLGKMIASPPVSPKRKNKGFLSASSSGTSSPITPSEKSKKPYRKLGSKLTEKFSNSVSGFSNSVSGLFLDLGGSNSDLQLDDEFTKKSGSSMASMGSSVGSLSEMDVPSPKHKKKTTREARKAKKSAIRRLSASFSKFEEVKRQMPAKEASAKSELEALKEIKAKKLAKKKARKEKDATTTNKTTEKTKKKRSKSPHRGDKAAKAKKPDGEKKKRRQVSRSATFDVSKDPAVKKRISAGALLVQGDAPDSPPQLRRASSDLATYFRNSANTFLGGKGTEKPRKKKTTKKKEKHTQEKRTRSSSHSKRLLPDDVPKAKSASRGEKPRSSTGLLDIPKVITAKAEAEMRVCSEDNLGTDFVASTATTTVPAEKQRSKAGAKSERRRSSGARLRTDASKGKSADETERRGSTGVATKRKSETSKDRRGSSGARLQTDIPKGKSDERKEKQGSSQRRLQTHLDLSKSENSDTTRPSARTAVVKQPVAEKQTAAASTTLQKQPVAEIPSSTSEAFQSKADATKDRLSGAASSRPPESSQVGKSKSTKPSGGSMADAWGASQNLSDSLHQSMDAHAKKKSWDLMKVLLDSAERPHNLSIPGFPTVDDGVVEEKIQRHERAGAMETQAPSEGQRHEAMEGAHLTVDTPAESQVSSGAQLDKTMVDVHPTIDTPAEFQVSSEEQRDKAMEVAHSTIDTAAETQASSGEQQDRTTVDVHPAIGTPAETQVSSGEQQDMTMVDVHPTAEPHGSSEAELDEAMVDLNPTIDASGNAYSTEVKAIPDHTMELDNGTGKDAAGQMTRDTTESAVSSKDVVMGRSDDLEPKDDKGTIGSAAEVENKNQTVGGMEEKKLSEAVVAVLGNDEGSKSSLPVESEFANMTDPNTLSKTLQQVVQEPQLEPTSSAIMWGQASSGQADLHAALPQQVASSTPPVTKEEPGFDWTRKDAVRSMEQEANNSEGFAFDWSQQSSRHSEDDLKVNEMLALLTAASAGAPANPAEEGNSKEAEQPQFDWSQQGSGHSEDDLKVNEMLSLLTTASTGAPADPEEEGNSKEAEQPQFDWTEKEKSDTDRSNEERGETGLMSLITSAKTTDDAAKRGSKKHEEPEFDWTKEASKSKQNVTEIQSETGLMSLIKGSSQNVDVTKDKTDNEPAPNRASKGKSEDQKSSLADSKTSLMALITADDDASEEDEVVSLSDESDSDCDSDDSDDSPDNDDLFGGSMPNLNYNPKPAAGVPKRRYSFLDSDSDSDSDDMSDSDDDDSSEDDRKKKGVSMALGKDAGQNQTNERRESDASLVVSDLAQAEDSASTMQTEGAQSMPDLDKARDVIKQQPRGPKRAPRMSMIVGRSESSSALENVQFTPSNFVQQREDRFDNHYELGQLLGEGEFGEVFIGYQKQGNDGVGEERAIKIIDKERMCSGDYEQVINEFNLLKGLTHPNLLTLYGFYEDEGNCYIVTDLCKGGELWDELDTRGAFGEGDTAAFMTNLLSAVKFLQSHNIVHRDLNLENILLEESKELDQMKIIDFGLATKYEDGVKLSDLVGKVHYVAPEVLEQSYEGSKYDVWSCGVVCFILLSGYAPFEGDNDMLVMEQVTIGKVDFNDPAWENISDEAKDFVKYLLTYEEDARPTAAQALQHAWIQNSIKANEETFMQDYGDSSVSCFENLFDFASDPSLKLKQAVYTYIASQLLRKEEREEIDRVFRGMDSDRDGKLSKEDIRKGYKRFFDKELSNKETDKLFERINMNGDGYVDYTEFVIAAMQKSKILDTQKLRAAFSSFDRGDKGYISANDLKLALAGVVALPTDKDIGTDQIIDEMMKQVDVEGDGKISYQNFADMMLHESTGQVVYMSFDDEDGGKKATTAGGQSLNPPMSMDWATASFIGHDSDENMSHHGAISFQSSVDSILEDEFEDEED
ncbi:MAP kinase-activated protein kinase 2 (Fragment) [Seminavis robusta]|uniref:MAP kinase-activated protein kinase 2 n=1 Tax=Seminavis robusta TaxID=568900 RepID=A0A9N8HAC7_9STRA